MCVLDVYTRPYDPRRPVICLDETSKQLLRETRPGRPTAPGRVARVDYEYEREGVVNLFLCGEPLAGQRWVDVRYPAAERIVLVMDNLNVHTPGALYDAFAPAEAKRLADKLEIHHTPKYGSWLTIAEIELSVLSRHCLDRRVPDAATLQQEVQAWHERRNAAVRTVDWRFTTQDARIKLKRLYPSLQE